MGDKIQTMLDQKKYRQSRFNTAVKIDRKQLIWLKENMDTKTIAGFLDKIINQYKDGNIKGTNTDKGISNPQ